MGPVRIASGLPTTRQDNWNLFGFRCWARAGFPNVTSPSGQAYAPEKILKALIRAVSVKNRVDREVSHPNSVIFIGGFQPFECFLILI